MDSTLDTVPKESRCFKLFLRLINCVGLSLLTDKEGELVTLSVTTLSRFLIEGVLLPEESGGGEEDDRDFLDKLPSMEGWFDILCFCVLFSDERCFGVSEG